MSEKVSPKPPPPKQSPTANAARAPSNPGFSNARMAAVKTAAPPQTAGAKVKNFFADLGLNTLATLKELAEDFKRSDRFFKYKVGIIAAWLALSALGVIVAIPRSGGNSLDAKLTVTTVVGDRVYSLKNLGKKPWTEITVVANGTYRLAAPQVEPNEMLTFEAKRLTGANGQPAPRDLNVTDMILKTAEGDAVLVKEGEPVD